MQAERQGHGQADQETGQRRPDELPGQLLAGPERAVRPFQLRRLDHPWHKGLGRVVAQDLGAAQKERQRGHPQNRRRAGAGRQGQHQKGQRDRDAHGIGGHQQAAVVKAVGDDARRQREQKPRQRPRPGDQSDQERIVGQKRGQPRYGYRHHPVAKVHRRGRGAEQEEAATVQDRDGHGTACFLGSSPCLSIRQGAESNAAPTPAPSPSPCARPSGKL